MARLTESQRERRDRYITRLARSGLTPARTTTIEIIDGGTVYSETSEDGVLVSTDGPRSRRKFVVARFDVTDLDQDEIDYLVGEITAQADRSEGHPSVPDPIITQEEEGGTT